MSIRATLSVFGLTRMLVAGIVLSMAWVSTATAGGDLYSVTGNARSQIGGGLPLPITTVAPPTGAVPFGGFIRQTTGADPKAITLPQSGNMFGPETTTIGVFQSNSQVLQVQTSLIVTGPKERVVFKAGGRSGPAVFTWCPGLPLPTASFNPSCTNPLATGIGITTQASIRYEATAAQFGGVSQPKVGGPGVNGTGALVALRGGAVAAGSCDFNVTPTCVAAFSYVIPGATGVVGGPIGNLASSPSPGPIPVFQVAHDAAGNVTAVGPQVGTTASNGVIGTWGAPWTTGKVTVKAPNNAETYYLEGSDNRVNGVGTLSLVAGGVSNRARSGDNANRGWQNFVIGAQVSELPAISNVGLMMLALILGATTVLMVRRAMVTNS